MPHRILGLSAERRAVLGMLMALAIWVVVVNVFFPPPPKSETPLPEAAPVATDTRTEPGEVERPVERPMDAVTTPVVAATSTTDFGDSSGLQRP